MSCDCYLCRRHKELREVIGKLERYTPVPEFAIKALKDYESALSHTEMDRDVGVSVIDGSWPNGDQQIYAARKKRLGDGWGWNEDYETRMARLEAK